MKKCNKNRNKCKQLNTRTDDRGHPFGYECMKYNDSVFKRDFLDAKEFGKEETLCQ